MKEIIILMLIPFSLAAHEPSYIEKLDRYDFMKQMLTCAEIYSEDVNLMCWVDGYCCGLKYAMDGKISPKDGPVHYTGDEPWLKIK